MRRRAIEVGKSGEAHDRRRTREDDERGCSKRSKVTLPIPRTAGMNLEENSCVLRRGRRAASAPHPRFAHLLPAWRGEGQRPVGVARQICRGLQAAHEQGISVRTSCLAARRQSLVGINLGQAWPRRR